jgi:putative transposase
MKRLQSFKFELKLSSGEKRLLSCFAGSCRYVYNKALALQKERYEKGDKKLNYAGICKEITVWRNGSEFS